MSAEEPSAPAAQGHGAAAHPGAGVQDSAPAIEAAQTETTAADSATAVQHKPDGAAPEVERSGQVSSAASTDAAHDKVGLEEEQPGLQQPPAAAGANGDGGPVTRTSTTESKRIPLDQQPLSKRLIVMFALCMAVFLAALDMTIVATALPTIANDFKISSADYTWVGSAYLMACAASTPPWGKISDIFGRKPMLLLANVLFFVGSLICGVSINIKMLLAGRVVQGMGGGGLLTLVNICIGDLFSMRARGAYYGFVGGVWAIAGAIGPVLGGAFTEYVNWRWCFYINLPCDGIAFAVLIFYLNIDTPKTPIVQGLAAIDWLGLLLVTGATLMFLFGLEDGGVTYPWNSATVICLIVIGLFTLVVLFPLIESKVAKYPLMPLRLFTKRNALVSFGVAFFHGIVFMSASYYLPLYFQTVQRASPLLSGVYQFPFILSLSLTSSLTGITIRKTGNYRELIWVGMALMLLGFGLFILLPDTLDWARIAPFQIIAGLGVGPGFQAPLISLQSSLHPKDMATGTATFAFIRQLASAISLVVGGVIFQNEVANHYSTLRTALDPQTAGQLAYGSAGAAIGVIRALPPSAQAVISQVYTESLRTMWIFYTAMAAGGVICSVFLGKKVLSDKHEVRKQGLEQQEKDRQEELAREAEKKHAKSGGRARDIEKADAGVVSQTGGETS